jgi:L-malate glycosyltransferase
LSPLASAHQSGSFPAAQKLSRDKVFLMTNTLEVGGSERQFAMLVESLNRERFEVQPACLRWTGGLTARLGKIPEFPLGGRLIGFQAQRTQWDLFRHLRGNKVGVAHAFDFYTNLVLLPAARLAGVPAVGSHRQLGDLLTPIQFKAQYWAFRMADKVVCNSRAAAATLYRQGLPQAKVEIIPNGLAKEAFAEPPPAIARRPGVVRVGMIARMNSPAKNHGPFLHAAAQLVRQGHPVEFVLVGDGPLRPGLEQLAAELGIGEKVLFAGERHDIPGILASLDLSALISSSESLSNAILESMAAGVPVVATNVGGNAELVKDGETGRLVPANDEKGLVDALALLVRDAATRAQYAAHSRAFARSEFHIDQIGRRFEQLYLGLIPGQR